MSEDAWRDKARNLFASGLLGRAIEALEAARRRNPDDLGIGKRLIDVYRAEGRLASAAALAAELAAGTARGDRVRYLDDLLSGRPASPATVEDNDVPSPFVLFDAFLPEALFNAVREAALDLLPSLTAATVSDKVEAGDANLRVDKEVRRSSKVPNPPGIQEVLRPRVREVLGDCAARLGLADLTPGPIELELGVYRDGDYFTRHQDLYTSARSRRAISFVFFCSAEPRPFSGGDLLLYDQRRLEAESTSINFTRIEPIPNRLVLFEPSTFHEVTPVHCAPDDPLTFRYTATGWVHEAAGG